MFPAKFLIFVGVLKLFNAAQAVPSLSPCHGKKNGFHTNAEYNCQKYFYCNNGQVTQNGTCPADFAYSPQKQKCVPKLEVLCIDIQCRNVDQYYTIPGTKCSMYYKCEADRRSDYVCAEDMTFSYELQTCVKRAVCYEPLCTGRINGEFADTTQNCERSFRCQGGEITSIENCGPGEIYSNTARRCVHSTHSVEMCTALQGTAMAHPVDQMVNTCDNLSDGAYIVPNSQCQEYFICKGNTNLGTLGCGNRYIFNGRECVPEQYFECKDPGCSKLSDGIHTDLISGCQDYFYCLDGHILWKDSCPVNTLYNGLKCVNSAYYTCPSEVVVETNVCLHRKDGYHRNFAKCNEYFYCANNELVLKGSCPGDQVWNGQICVDKGWFFCDGPTEWIGCVVKKGFFQDTSHRSRCTEYYYCANGNVTRYSCPPTESFDGEKCVPKYIYDCPIAQDNQCEFLPDGYHPDYYAKCQSYFYCSQGLKSVYFCPENETFDGQKCVANSTFQCPELQYDVCATKPDGLYTLPKTACQKYFQCQHGRATKVFSCPPNQVFDSMGGCVLRNCTNIFNQNCAQDGFFVELDSKCRSYYFCIEGKKTQLECPTGKIFNGQICVSADIYICPEHCNRFKDCDNSVL